MFLSFISSPQCRDAILDGTHPVTLERACRFAGIQCQIQFGDYVDTKHKVGFLEWVALCFDGYYWKGITLEPVGCNTVELILKAPEIMVNSLERITYIVSS